MASIKRLAAPLIGTLLMAATTLGCGLMDPFGNRDRPREIAIPTSAVPGATPDVVLGELRVDGSCLYLIKIEDNRQGPHLLPIWPPGYRAKAWSMGHGVYRPDEWPDFAFVAGAERLELRGAFVDAPPPDAVIPPDCPALPFFVVAEAINRADG